MGQQTKSATIKAMGDLVIRDLAAGVARNVWGVYYRDLEELLATGRVAKGEGDSLVLTEAGRAYAATLPPLVAKK
jgi:hypothetical protein